MSLHDLVKQVSIDLNDNAVGYEYTTWSEEQLAAYVIEGLQVAFTLRPDLFMHAEVIPLENGTSVQRPCNCTKIRRIYGVSTKDGRVLYSLRKRKDSEKLNWFGHTCPVNPRNYRIYEYVIDNQGDTFYVNPPPPAGQTTYVMLECAEAPTADNISTYNIPVEIEAPAIQWALYRARMVDSENNNNVFTVALRHKEACFQLLNAQVQLKDVVEVDHTSPTTTNARVIGNGN